MEHISKKCKVSLEPLIERKLQHVSQDGKQEFVKLQTSQQRMQALVEKFDFLQEEGDEDTENEGESKKENENVETNFITDVNGKLVHAMSEIDVLTDVLNLVSTDKYLKPLEVESRVMPKQDLHMRFQARKEHLGQLQKQFIDSSNRLRRLVAKENQFFQDLIGVRKYWRMTCTGRNMFVDVSYMTAGSVYGSRIKVDIEKSNMSSGSTAVGITIPKECKASKCLQLRLNSEETGGVYDHTRLLPEGSSTNSSFEKISRLLAKARSAMFFQDMFNTITKEGLETSHSKPSLLIDNEMQMTLEHNAKLSFVLDEPVPIPKKPSIMSLQNTALSVAMCQSMCRLYKAQKQNMVRDEEEIPELTGSNVYKKINECVYVLQETVDIVQHALCRQRVDKLLEQLSFDIRGIMVLRIHWLSYEHAKYSSSVRLILKPPKSVFSWGYVDPNFTLAIQLNINVNRIEMHLADRRYANIRECDLVSKLLCQVNLLLVTVITTQAETNNCVVLKGPTARGVDCGGLFETFCPDSNSFLNIELSAASPSQLFRKITITRKKKFSRMVQGGSEISTRPFSTVPSSQGRKMSVIEMASGSFSDDEAVVENVDWAQLRGRVLMEKFQTLLLKLMFCE